MTTTKKEQISRGSEWRKWDLHVHTPDSYDWDSKCKSTNKDIVDKAISAGISAIAITDHHSVDSIDEIKRLGKEKGLFVIPGVELRTDKGNEKIHLIGLFDASITGQIIYDKILSPLNLSEVDIKKEGNEQIYCDFKDACEKIHALGGLVFLHAGNKSNGIEQLDSDIKATLKTDLASLVDIFEINTQKNFDDYWNIVFPKIKSSFPCAITSDSIDRSKLLYDGGHSNEVIGKAYTWIKADLSLAGLKQIIAEPKSRVFLGVEPPKLADLRNNPTRYIDSITIAPSSQSSPSWFNSSIPLNQELIAIIGKKGSGKSALVDIIALCGKSHTPTSNYSFLHPNKFRKNLAIAKKYEGEIKWLDGEKVSMNLGNEVDIATEPERVKYLPQSFVERICNEDGVSKLFQEEINKVIFSYVSPAKRLGTNSLAELLKIKSEVTSTKINRVRDEIKTSNHTITALEEKKTGEYKKKIEESLKEKENVYKSVKDPKPVKQPTKGLSEAQQLRLQKIEDTLTGIEKEIAKAGVEQGNTNKALSFIERLDAKLKDLEENKEKIIDSFLEEAKSIDFDLEKIIELDIKKDVIILKQTALKKRLLILDAKLDKESTDLKTSLYAKRTSLELAKEGSTKSLDVWNKKYQEYLAQKKKIIEKRKGLFGVTGDKSLETIVSLREELSYLSKELDVDFKKECEARRELVSALYKAISEMITQYEEIYQPLISFIEKEKKEQKRSGSTLTFDAGIVFNKSSFSEKFLSFINQGREGSFHSKDAGNKLLKEILNQYGLQKQDEAIKLTDEILHNLKYDTTKTPEKENEVGKQINQKYSSVDIYNFLYQLEYIDVKFKILFNGKDLNENEFSPGEKGALLLIFYLLIDNAGIPLIMDQPEENLDNESVYSILVPYIKRAKEKRQIIIVTHNPNIAVVCDAEQVICASMDKKKNEIRYESGSIENLYINKKIVDILEGTMPAFAKRDEKYQR